MHTWAVGCCELKQGGTWLWRTEGLPALAVMWGTRAGSEEGRELEGGIGAIHSLSKHVLSTCCVPGSVLGPGDGAVNVTDRVPALTELTC